MKKVLLFFLLLIPSFVYAEQDHITPNCKITYGDIDNVKTHDSNYTTFDYFTENTNINITCEENISYIYIMYNEKSSEGKASYNGKDISIGKNKFLHELVSFKGDSKTVTIDYTENYSIAEIFVFNKILPSWVEDWEILDKADMMLFSSHADDEQLFFAGLLPLYTDQNYKIQVVYFTNHYNNTLRYHEQLEGLWAVGIKYYPVISPFPDAYSESLEGATANLNNAGYSTEDALLFQVHQIRKYKPLVVVGHDEKGEYSHGQHILNTHLLKEAILKAGDESYGVDSVMLYGTHNINKLYLHLYEENPIVLNLDEPLESFDGLTAYEVAKKGYAKHYSQQYTWFTAWLNGANNEYTSATQITTYSPCNYGLYYSSVGEDTKKNSMFENINIKPDNVELLINVENKTNKKDNASTQRITKKNLYTIVGVSLMFLSSVGFVVLYKKH